MATELLATISFVSSLVSLFLVTGDALHRKDETIDGPKNRRDDNGGSSPEHWALVKLFAGSFRVFGIMSFIWLVVVLVKFC